MKNTRTFVKEPNFIDAEFTGTCDGKALLTDFNDMHQLFGLMTVRETPLEYPNPEYTFFHIK